jgi:tRNA nucleotidyltransferase (CCA-adding enzyme)
MRIVSPGHESVGVPVTENFLERINAPLAIRERVIPLVANHLAHYQKITDRALRRLAKRLEPENIHGLCTVMTADSMGRPPCPAVVPENVKVLLSRARELEIQANPPKPILLGRHLLELGLSPGKELGEILCEAFDAQIDGKFFDLPQAFRWLERQKKFQLPENVLEQLRLK